MKEYLSARMSLVPVMIRTADGEGTRLLSFGRESSRSWAVDPETPQLCTVQKDMRGCQLLSATRESPRNRKLFVGEPFERVISL